MNSRVKCVSDWVNFISTETNAGVGGGGEGAEGAEGGGGVRHWVTLDTRLCRLTVWAGEEKVVRLDEINMMGATFTYDLENNNSGQFKIRSDIRDLTRHLVI